MFDGLSEVDSVYPLLECSPVSVALLKVTGLLVGTVVANPSVIQVVGGVGGVYDTWDTAGHHTLVLAEGVVVLPIDTVCPFQIASVNIAKTITERFCLIGHTYNFS